MVKSTIFWYFLVVYHILFWFREAPWARGLEEWSSKLRIKEFDPLGACVQSVPEWDKESIMMPGGVLHIFMGYTLW